MIRLALKIYGHKTSKENMMSLAFEQNDRDVLR